MEWCAHLGRCVQHHHRDVFNLHLSWIAARWVLERTRRRGPDHGGTPMTPQTRMRRRVAAGSARTIAVCAAVALLAGAVRTAGAATDHAGELLTRIAPGASIDT